MSVSSRILAYETIRNIPYSIPLTPDEHAYNCATKAAELQTRLADLGLQSRQIICTFKWEETPIPPEILSLPRDYDETHLFLEVLIPETKTWVKCDPTWDDALKKHGFLTSEWDGLSDTTLGVIPHHIYTEEETKGLIEKFSDSTLIKNHFKTNTFGTK